MNGKIVFFGTSAICLDFLNNIHNNFDLPLIITLPDSQGGRNKKIIESPVKLFAVQKGIKFLQPSNLRSKKLREFIRDFNPDIGVVISYGKLIPPSIIKIPQYKIINLHFSLLPKYRGAAPVQRAIENGETISGISIFEINKKMDEGEIFSQLSIPIDPDDTSDTLFKSMCQNGQDLLLSTIKGILNGQLKKYPQDHTKATYAPPILKEEGLIDWNLDAKKIYNKFKAFFPRPSVFFKINDKNFKVNQMIQSDPGHDSIPGTILKICKHSLKICCGNNSVIEILIFQPQGKKPMAPYSYCLGNKLPEILS